MKRNTLLVAGMVLLMSIAVFGQANLTGKWQTDSVPAALEAEKNALSAERGRGGGVRRSLWISKPMRLEMSPAPSPKSETRQF
jgi:hypothetical protein